MVVNSCRQEQYITSSDLETATRWFEPSSLNHNPHQPSSIIEDSPPCLPGSFPGFVEPENTYCELYIEFMTVFSTNRIATYKHLHTRARTHTSTHAHTRTRTHIQHTRAHTRTHTRAHTHIRSHLMRCRRIDLSQRVLIRLGRFFDHFEAGTDLQRGGVRFVMTSR